MNYKTNEIRLGVNDDALEEPRAGEVALRIDSTGAVHSMAAGGTESQVGGLPEPYTKIVMTVYAIGTGNPNGTVHENTSPVTVTDIVRIGVGLYEILLSGDWFGTGWPDYQKNVFLIGNKHNTVESLKNVCIRVNPGDDKNKLTVSAYDAADALVDKANFWIEMRVYNDTGDYVS